MPASPEVEFRNVTFAYGNKLILDDVSLTIHRGESVAVIGPSGTGKSSFIRLISGLSLPTSGSILIRSVARTAKIQDDPRPDTSSAKIAVVFQNPALFSSMSIAENVGFQLIEHSDLSWERIDELVVESLKAVGLKKEVMTLNGSQLSGGMQKRVSFARAVTHDPDDSTGVCRCPDVLLLVGGAY